MASLSYADLSMRRSCCQVQTDHPHAQAHGATVGGLERRVAFSSFRERGWQCHQLDPCGGWGHATWPGLLYTLSCQSQTQTSKTPGDVLFGVLGHCSLTTKNYCVACNLATPTSKISWFPYYCFSLFCLFLLLFNRSLTKASSWWGKSYEMLLNIKDHGLGQLILGNRLSPLKKRTVCLHFRIPKKS